MPQVLRNGLHRNRTSQAHRIRILNTDGERHPMENSLAVTALVLGLCALVLGFIAQTHVFGAVLGVIGLPLALYSQMISATVGERWLNVIGMISAFVGFGFALRHGGFVP